MSATETTNRYGIDWPDYSPGQASDRPPHGPTVVVDVPARFYADHVGRDLDSGWVVKHLARTSRVTLDAAAYDELLSDAEHYAGDAMSDMYADDFATASALIRSAAATVKALRAAGRPGGDR